MGVLTKISLQEVKELFTDYSFTHLALTKDGIMDTTYIVSNTEQPYILKRYERDISSKIIADTKLLLTLFENGLNVPICLGTNKGWYLYKKLDGEIPQHIQSFHIAALGRFMSRLHKETKNIKSDTLFIEAYDLKTS